VAKKISKVKYHGRGERFVPGVPTRDLDGDEWRALPEDQRKIALHDDLYTIEYDEPAEESRPRAEPAKKDDDKK
jgi:hypothetical protein